jgi:hypothetical protein
LDLVEVVGVVFRIGIQIVGSYLQKYDGREKETMRREVNIELRIKQTNNIL